MSTENPLQIEIDTFESIKETLLADEGKFAVISGRELIGVFASYEDALKTGYDRAKLAPFLVKKIAAIDPINFFTRDILQPCHT